MKDEVFFQLVRWLQDNYGETSISGLKFKDEIHTELCCKLTNQVMLKVTAQASDEEGLTDYTAALWLGGLDSIGDVPNIHFRAYDRNAIKVIDHITDLVAGLCMQMLPNRMIVYEAR